MHTPRGVASGRGLACCSTLPLVVLLGRSGRPVLNGVHAIGWIWYSAQFSKYVSLRTARHWQVLKVYMAATAVLEVCRRTGITVWFLLTCRHEWTVRHKVHGQRKVRLSAG